MKNFFYKNNFFFLTNLDFIIKLFLFFRFLKNQKNVFFLFNSFWIFKINQKFFKFFFFFNKFRRDFFFFNRLFINFKMKVGFLKKFNKIKSIYFYKYWKLNKKFRAKNKSFLKNFSKTFDLKKKIFFLLKENRSILKDLFFSKFIKQKKITKFVHIFKHFPIKKIIFFFEFSLFNILIQSHFLVFKKDVIFFLKNNLVFVNGRVVSNKFFFLGVGDRVQLVLNNEYYFFFRSFNKILKAFSYKIRLSVRKIFLKKKDLYKQKASRVPNWVERIIFNKQVIPKYLEVDFFTLTSVVLRYSNNYYENNFVFFKFLSYFNIRLYNWKKLN